MTINASIPLAGTVPNFFQTVVQADQAGAVQQENLHRRDMRNFLRENGQAIYAGDEKALGGYAAFDPSGALNIRGQHQQMRHAEERLRLARAAGARAAANARMSREQAAQTKQEYEQLRSLALMREASPEAFAQGLNTLGLSQQGVTPENFDLYLATADGAAQQLFGALNEFNEARQGPKPDYKLVGTQFIDMNNPMAGAQDIPNVAQEAVQPQFMNVDGVAYRVEGSQLVPVTEPRERAPLVNIMNGEQSGGTAPGGIVEPIRDVPDGSGRLSFGATGLAGNTINAITDFATGREAFPNIGQNTRFFRNLEEEMLVPLAQAYPRQPAQQLMERLRSLLPNVGTLEGANAALRELQLMENRFARDLQAAERRANRSIGSTTQQAELERQIVGLQSLVNQVNEAKRRLTPASPLQISPEVEERLRAYE